MAIVGKYINEDDCKARLSASVWIRICDDDADGVADDDPGQLLVSTAEGFVEGRLGGIYDLATMRAQGRASIAHEVRRIVLDVLEAYAIRRHPSYIRGDWRMKLDDARKDLADIRQQIAQLDTADAPEPAAKVGGEAQSGDPDDTEPVAAVFLGPGKMGLF